MPDIIYTYVDGNIINCSNKNLSLCKNNNHPFCINKEYRDKLFANSLTIDYPIKLNNNSLKLGNF